MSSTKAIHGHSLGASGVLETVLCLKAIEHQTVLPTFHLNEVETELGIPVCTSPQKTPLNHILKNTLGFGGANGALVISRVVDKR